MQEKRNASAPAASPANANDDAKQSASAGKHAPKPTVGASRPATAAKHVKEVPERPASTAQPSSTASRRSRSKTTPPRKCAVILSKAKDLNRPISKPSRPRSRSSKRNRSKLASPAAINAAVKSAFGDGTTIAAHPVSATPPPRIRIGDAMRRSGLDEYKVARTFAVVVDKLSDGKTAKDTGGVQKLLVDVLKECSRHLDPPQSERAAPAAPAQIIMVHNVPRPFRTQPPPQQLNAAPTTDAQSSAQATDAAAPSATPANEPVAKSDTTPSS